MSCHNFPLPNSQYPQKLKLTPSKREELLSHMAGPPLLVLQSVMSSNIEIGLLMRSLSVCKPLQSYAA